MRKVSPLTVTKRINALKEELKDLEGYENKSSSFSFNLGQDKEALRPSYDFEETQKRYMELTQEIIQLKHAINLFNTTTMVPEFNMTVDQMLVYLPMLRERKQTLQKMKDEPMCGHSSSITYRGVRYTYSIYSVKKVTEDYRRIADEYAKAHTALDLVNATGEIEVDW